jgi:predicted lysophospholipase L1 biosynthesis ABC-type transport system permease subunit
MSATVLGVAGLVAIDSLAANATSGVHEQARSLVGGDVAVSPRDTVPPDVAYVLDSLSTRGSGVTSLALACCHFSGRKWRLSCMSG